MTSTIHTHWKTTYCTTLLGTLFDHLWQKSLGDMQRGTTVWSYWCWCFTTICGPLVCQIHSLQVKRGISIPINFCVQCCQGNWIKFSTDMLWVQVQVYQMKRTLNWRSKVLSLNKWVQRCFPPTLLISLTTSLEKKETTHLICWSWSFQNTCTWGWQHTARSSMSWLSMQTNNLQDTHSHRISLSKISKDKRTCMYICT